MSPRIKAPLLAAYGAPATAFAMLLLPPYVFLPAFYTQTLGLPLDWIGYIIAFSRIFDAITDPIVGVASDRTVSRFGRRKVWIAAGTPLAAAAVVLLFAPPFNPSLAQFGAGIFALTLAWTMLLLPYSAWGAELSGDYNERTRITSVREGFGLAGTLIAASTPTVMTLAGYADPRSHMAALAAIVVLLMVPTVAWLLVRVPDVAVRASAAVPLRQGLRAIADNALFRRLIFAYLINALANGLPATLFLLFVSHVIGAQQAYGPLLLAYFLAGLLGIPLWMRLAQRYGKHKTWAVAMMVASGAFAFTPLLVGEGNVTAFLIITIVSGIGFGADLALPSAIQADVVDVDRQATGVQRTGLFFALWGIATKLSFALAALSLPVLHAAGFSADTFDAQGRSANDAAALFTLTLFYAVLPVALKAVAVALMWNFPLNADRQRAVRAGLEAQ